MTSSREVDPRVQMLSGGHRRWWDVSEERFVEVDTIYIPFGCPDWGERGGSRNSLCTFCPLPGAVQAYREAFYGGLPVPADEEGRLVREALGELDPSSRHTLMLFNGGSFLAMPSSLQLGIILAVIELGGFKRLVIESRAGLVTRKSIKPIADVLGGAGIGLTVRIGVETKDDHLRLHVLKKGHKRSELVLAVQTLHDHGALVGGYALLNPAPNLEPEWAIYEAKQTLDWILGSAPIGLNMDEAYFCSTNVGQGTLLEREWREGKFAPASLSMVLVVLRHAASRHGTRAHLLPFKDEPELLAVPSNHSPQGIAQDLHDAKGCDREFHEMLDRYRETMDSAVLIPPRCVCNA
ncbi:MAG: hypothetical protein AAB495_00355 [Patescibacteria group bacterium]